MQQPVTYPAANRAPVTIQNKAGDVIRTSKNLRGVLRYASEVSPVNRIYCTRATPFDPSLDSYYSVEFVFDDGSTAFTNWADWRVLVDWIYARRSWRFTIARVNGMMPFIDAMADYLWKFRRTA